ncbi:MAG TPA: UDP-N-acetylmuramoyl-L-alanine--D-glutamate ligase [Vicinamibacteria bacterium]|nr:UDP-N-acetylmuramoyl-L-alanine--D-glutamate ligase [Vicinamibacteria bacterium]
MGVEGKPVVVVGLARSGIKAAQLLARSGAAVVATDRKPARELTEEALSLQERGVRLELGGHAPGTFLGAAMIVVSPGVPWDLPELEAARRAGVPVIAELELGFRQITGTVAAVTGTKGKSTTTAALGAMLREAGKDVRVGGNIGQALTGLLEGAGRETHFVLEVSSFQLEGTERFHPRLALVLNLSADHLDRHRSFEDYVRAKGRIFRNMTADDWTVVNADEPQVLALARDARARLVLFRAAPDAAPPEGDAAYFAKGEARLRLGGRDEALFALRDVRLPGAHLAADLLAAAAGARLLGATPEAIARAVRGFDGVEHVLERVAEIAGVTFFNDSKATNVDAAIKSLEAFSRPVLAIMGGRFKGGDLGLLQPSVEAHAKAVFVIGEAREALARALAAAAPVVWCESLREAVERAYAAAEPGDAVVLAPACASFDMFRDYADRGRAFKACVQELARATRERSADG